MTTPSPGESKFGPLSPSPALRSEFFFSLYVSFPVFRLLKLFSITPPDAPKPTCSRLDPRFRNSSEVTNHLSCPQFFRLPLSCSTVAAALAGGEIVHRQRKESAFSQVSSFRPKLTSEA